MYLVIDRYHESRPVVVFQHQEKLIPMGDAFMFCVNALDTCLILSWNASNTNALDSMVKARERILTLFYSAYRTASNILSSSMDKSPQLELERETCSGMSCRRPSL